jgi:hypothetical protein
VSLRPNLAAARALVHCYQLSLLDVELTFFVHYPFVVTVATQSIPFVLFFQGRFLERENIGHGTSMEEMIDAYNLATKTKVSTAVLVLACPGDSAKKIPIPHR